MRSLTYFSCGIFRSRRTFSILTDANHIVHEQYQQTTKELLDPRRYPVGSFSIDQYKQAEHVLDYIKRKNQITRSNKNKKKDNDVDTTSGEWDDIPDSMALLQRLVQETAKAKPWEHVNHLRSRPVRPFFCRPRYYAPIIDRWRHAAIRRRGNVMLPSDMILQLRQMKRTLPSFQYDAHILGIILDVIVQTSHPRKAPILAERFLKATQKEATKSRNEHLQPNAVWYCLVAQAWAISGLPEAPQKIEALIQNWPLSQSDMNQKNGSSSNNDIGTYEQRSNLVPYNILLRLWASRGSIHEMERTLSQIQERGWDLDMVSCLALVHGYSQAGMIEKAECMFSKMISWMHPSNEQHAHSIGTAARDLLLAFRDKIGAFMQPERVRSEMAQRAQRWHRQIQRLGILDRRRQNVLQGIMRDILIQAGMCQEALNLSSLSKTYNTVELTVLLKTYGKNGMAPRASSLIVELLDDVNVRLDTIAFNTTINAWAESSMTDSVEQAFSLLKLMDEHPRAKELGIRPNRVTFGALLKCLLYSQDKEKSKKAEGILDEMQRRHRKGQSDVSPDVIVYSQAIRCCLNNNDMHRAEMLLSRMEKSDTPPSTRIFSDLLLHVGKAGTRASAERAEAILSTMKHLAKTERPNLKPDVVNYALVIDAWRRTDEPDASDQIWKVFNDMVDNGVAPNSVLMNTLITHFSKEFNSAFDKKVAAVEKANILLLQMEQSNSDDLRPDFRNFAPVIAGYCGVNDPEGAEWVLWRWVESIQKHGEGAISAAQFDIVAKAWISAGELSRASDFVRKAHHHFVMNHIPIGPDHITFKKLITAWRMSSMQGSEVEVQKLTSLVASRHDAINRTKNKPTI